MKATYKPWSDKSEGVRKHLTNLFPLMAKSIANDECPECKINMIDYEFDNELYLAEYLLSGLCSKCQGEIFKEKG